MAWDVNGFDICDNYKKGNDDENQAKIIQDAVAKALNMHKDDFELIGDFNFVKVKDCSKLPKDGWRQEFSIHSKNAQEYDIKNSDMKVKYYPDDNHKITITKPTNSIGHYIDAIKFCLGLSVNVSNAQKALSDMEGKNQK